jgi:hypothetical protein
MSDYFFTFFQKPSTVPSKTKHKFNACALFLLAIFRIGLAGAEPSVAGIEPHLVLRSLGDCGTRSRFTILTFST